MNSKSFSLFALTVFSFVLVMGAVNATSSSTNGTNFTIQNVNVPASVAQSSGSFTITFDISNNGTTQNVDWASSTISNAAFSSFAPVTSTSLGNGVTSVSVVITFNSSSNVTISGKIVATPSSGTPATLSFSVPIISDVPKEAASCLGIGNPGQLKINSISFINNGLPAANTTLGDDNKWFPFENINTKVDVKNLGSDSVNNIEVDWGVWDTQTNQWVIVPSELKNIDLSNGKTKTLTQNFKIDNNMDVDLSSLTNGNHYQFYIIANGDINNGTSTAHTCTYRTQNAQIAIESDFVAFTKLNVPTTVQCGQTMQVTGELWNMGNNDQKSVSIDILGSDNSLKLSQNVIIGDISSFTSKQFSFSFIVPNNVAENNYGIKFNVLDENGNIFQETLNDHYSQFLLPFSVSGGCIPSLSLIGSVISGGEAGKPLVVKATVINSGTVTKTYTVNAADFQSWASSASVDQRTIILNPGASKDVSVTLNTNNDASGSQTFSLNLASESGQTVLTQPVSVDLTKSSGFSFSNSSMWVWILGALILILIIVIIIVAFRVGRRNPGSVKK